MCKKALVVGFNTFVLEVKSFSTQLTIFVDQLAKFVLYEVGMPCGACERFILV